MIKQAVILCGGLGSRLKPLTDFTPKPLVKVNGHPFIFYLLNQLKNQGIREVILLTGYLGNQIKNTVGNGGKFNLIVKYSHGPVDWDTGKRIYQAKKKLHKQFLLLYSDNFIPFDFSILKNKHKIKKSSLTLTLARKSPGNILLNGNLVKKYNNKRSKKLKYVEIGYMLITRDLILKEIKDANINFSKVISKLALKGKVNAIVNNNEYHSISDYKRLLLAEKYLEKKKILLIDRDGVINFKAYNARYINHWKEFSFIPRAVRSLKKLSSKGYSFIVITNQAGLARKITKQKNLNIIHRNMRTYLKKKGINILDIYYCPHHWNDNCNCRKPKPGMLQKAAKKYNFRIDQTCFIGDDSRDMQAAKEAGCKGILWKNNKKFLDFDLLVSNFFKKKKFRF